MNCQKDLFRLDPDIHYLNGAYMSPQLRSVEAAGWEGLKRKNNPQFIPPADFFDEVAVVKNKYARLINARPEQIAIIPSVSYGMSSALKNISCKKGQHALTIEDEFPSDFFSLQRWCEKNEASLKTVKKEMTPGFNWSEKILKNISEQTAVLVLSTVHWADGTTFNLEKIGQRCRETNTILVVDGTQSVGALPIDLKNTNIDVLICAAYKWLLGPYSIGLAYFSDYFFDGTPIEESWMNRTNARDFSRLSEYEAQYTPGAGRFNVGETSNFILMPMLHAALRQLLKWDPKNIQQYCKNLTRPLIQFMETQGGQLACADERAFHLLGWRLPEHIDPNDLVQKLVDQKIFVSRRGSFIRISPNVYNDANDIDALINVLSP